jgi:inorganic pyrophosphatase
MEMNSELPPFDEESGDLNAVIDTPKGSRNKYKLDEQRKVYRLSGVLPTGAVFPFDFGFVPSTLGGDGDPIDVLILMDEAAFTGCVVPSRLIGVLEASQSQHGKSQDNHRLIAVATASHQFKDIEELDQVGKNVVDEIEHFFVSYNAISGKRFEVRRRSGPERARKIVDEAIKRATAKGALRAEERPAQHAVAQHSEPHVRAPAAPESERAPRASKPTRARPPDQQGYTKRFGGPR